MAVATEAQFHVLAVDDSLVDRKLIERLLKSSSFQVTTVDSGSKALELLGLHHQQPQQQDLQKHPNSPSVSSYQQEIEVSLVITDYCMPGMTGYDLLKKIKESSSLKDIPVVIMSSENVPSRINRCLEEGADEFLLKPVKLSDVKKLRPHIMKGKSKELHQQQLSQPNQHQQQRLVEPSSEPEPQGSQKEQCMQLQQSIHHHHQPQEQQMKEQKQVQPPQQHLQRVNQNGSVTRTTTTTTATTPTTTSKPASGTKRKAVESDASTTSPDERPRPNYKVKGYGLTVV